MIKPSTILIKLIIFLMNTSTLNSNQNKMLVKIQQSINNFKNINK